mmetsp:Transcript_13502/g.34464  ORF Transcript_13502/g.34464 Transcript_13502/m.34464 type:complete len:85 (-) Transcript_13502:170-424(-)
MGALQKLQQHDTQIFMSTPSMETVQAGDSGSEEQFLLHKEQIVSIVPSRHANQHASQKTERPTSWRLLTWTGLWHELHLKHSEW